MSVRLDAGLSPPAIGAARPRWREPRSWWARYTTATAIIAAAVLVRLLFTPVVGHDLPLSTLYGGIAIIVWYLGGAPAIWSALLGYVACNWLIISPVHAFSTTSRDACGFLLFALGAGLVIAIGTRLRRAQMQAWSSHHRATEQVAELNAIYDGAPLGLAVLDPELRYRRINHRLAQINGVPVTEHIGRSVTDIVPSLAEQCTAALAQIYRTGQPVRMEFQGETRAMPGVGCAWDQHWFPLRHGTSIFAIAVIVEDITERRRQEQALRDSEALFRELAENVPQLTWMARPDGTGVWYNRRWFEYTGTTADEMKVHGWRIVQHPDYADRVLGGFATAVNQGLTWEDTFPMRDRDGRYRWFLTRAFPLRDNQGRITRWFGTGTDISVLRDTQDALRDAQRQIRVYAESLEKTVAERTARLQETVHELESFSYSIAHDMRAPLRAMIGYAELLREEHRDSLNEEGSDYLRRIGVSARRLDRLIQDILDYSRIVRDELPLEPVDLHQLVLEVIESYPNLSAVRDAIHLEDTLPVVLANRAALTQVLSNLLENAVKFVAKGQKPEVRVIGGRAEPPHEEGARPWTRISVVDNGIGIDASVRPRLFQMFQRFTRPGLYEGTGMGLAITRKAIERMGGVVGVDSAPGCGSCFWFCLPIESRAGAAQS